MASPSPGFRLLAIPPDGRIADLAIPDDLAPMIELTLAFYAKAGCEPPWVSYLATSDGVAVGGGAFVGAPKQGAVEIAYFTLEARRRQGFATRTARALVEIARRADAAVAIQAKTAPEPGASTRILERNGFERSGFAQDDEIGEAWLWTLKA